MSIRKCAVINCTNNNQDNYELSFFRFPKDENRCAKWVQFTGRTDLANKPAKWLFRNKNICIVHFPESEISSKNSKRRVLKHKAVPSLFDVSSQSSKSNNQEETTNKSLQPPILPKSTIDSNSSLGNNQEETKKKQSTEVQILPKSTIESNSPVGNSNNQEERKCKRPHRRILPKSTIDSNSSVGKIKAAFISSKNGEVFYLKTVDIANCLSLSSEDDNPIPSSKFSSGIKSTLEARLLLGKCRLCLLNHGEYKISAEDGLAEKISNYIKIELVENPNHPQSICTSCKTFLDSVHNFVVEVHAANKKLKSILGEPEASPQNKKLKQPIEKGDSVIDLEKDENSSTEGFMCEFCGEHFFLSVQYRLHKKTHAVVYVCDEKGCGQKFAEESQFKNHLNKHTPRKEVKKPALQQKKYRCRLCKKSFMKVTLLNEHKETHLNFECPLDDCTTILKNWKSFVSHMLLHNNSRGYLCEVCGKSFYTDNQFKQHETMHNDVKCDISDVNNALKTNPTKHSSITKETSSPVQSVYSHVRIFKP